MLSATRAQLHKRLEQSEFFALCFGAIVGIGWIVAVGDWLRFAGPGGAVLAFVAGGLVTLPVGFCYARMASLFPFSGGEVVYTYEVFGLRTCYLTGWLLTLSYITTTVFEGISMGWIVGTLLPETRGHILYSIHGTPVYLGSVCVMVVGMVAITLVNYLGVKPAATVQKAFTYSKIALVLMVASAGLAWGKFSNLTPLVALETPSSTWAGVFRVFLATPFWLAGFNTVAQVMEEKAARTPLASVGRMILLSILSAVIFYCLVILACSMTMPWPNLLKLDLPAATSFYVAFHSTWLTRTVLLVGLLGNFTVWNSIFLSASRILYALGRARIVSRRFSAVNARTGAPTQSVLFVGLLGCLGVCLGRGAILSMVNLSSTCLAITYTLVCIGVLRIRVSRPRQIASYRALVGKATAAAGVAGSLLILYLSLREPYRDAGGQFPIEWCFFLGWLGLGALFWIAGQKLRLELNETQRRRTILNTQAFAE